MESKNRGERIRTSDHLSPYDGYGVPARTNGTRPLHPTEELPNDLKKIVVEVNQAETSRAYTELLATDIAALQRFRDAGVNVQALPAPLEEQFASAGREFHARKAQDEEFSGRVLESYWDYVEAVRDNWGRV